jgi:protein phosphatase
MKLRVGAATDIGQARERNEDSYLVEPPLYVVADGMGGHRGGAEASSLAVQVLAEMPDHDPDHLPDQVRAANRAVFERQAGDRALSGMGTTVTAVIADGSTVELAHVGDSRAYLLRDGQLRQITEDHTLVQRMVRDGEISAEEAHVHPKRSILTRALGIDTDVEVDTQRIEVLEGDRLLLCSDGLTGMMRDESVREILQTHPEPQDAAEALVDSANRAGGLDNITVVVIDFVAGEGVEGVRDPGARPGLPRTAAADPAPDATGVIEPIRSEPEPPRARRRWRRVALWTVAIVVVVAAGLTAFRMYLDTQWYVGVRNSHVAVFRGLPTEILGFGLSSSVRETGIPVDEVAKLVPYRGIRDGLTAENREAADELVARIREDLQAERQRERQKERQTPVPTGSG